MLRAIYHSAFWDDVSVAATFLESRRPGCFAKFSVAVEAAIEAVLERPESFRKQFDEVRRILISRFRYVVLFEIWPDAIYFYGVQHGMRDLEAWLALRQGATGGARPRRGREEE